MAGLGYDGSIRINTKIDSDGFSKGLAKMSSDMEKQVKKSEKLLDDLQKKRKELSETAIIKTSELDAEKAKLESLKKNLQEIKEVAKDTSLSKSVRAEAKAELPGAQSAVKEQAERVRLLQTEWNKIQASIERYDARIEDTTQKLEQQRAEAEKISSSFDEERSRLEEINQTADVSDQRIIDLSHRLAELQARQKELSDSGLGIGYKEFDENEKGIQSITAELKNYQKALQDVASEQEKIGKFTGTLEEVRESISGVFSDFDAGKYAKGFEEIGTVMQLAGTKLAGSSEAVGAAFTEMGGAISAAAGPLAVVLVIVVSIVKAVKALLAAMQKFAQDSILKMAGVITACKNIAKALSPIGKLFEKAFSVTKNGVAKLVKSLYVATAGLVKFAAENNALTKVTDAVHSKLERLGNMIRRVFVFSVVTKGLRELRSELSSYLAINEQFSNSLRTLQGVLLTAFQPIYDAALPAIITLINIVSKAIAVISQFIAVLFGTTAKKAQQNAKNLYEQAHAVKAVGGAAKQAAKDAETAIAAFDEFNILSFPDNSGGGGGGAGGGIEMPNFEYEYEDFPFDSWGEAFSAFLDKLLDGLPKLEAAFKDFADWLNDLSKKLYDMFTFPGVLDKVKLLGKGLAEALNKLVDWIDWNQLGEALGAGLNLALNFLTSFLYSFDWMNLGRKLAEFVNGLVSEIDWYEFGRLLWAGFKIALETLAGFIMGLNMPEMSKAASNIVLGFFDEMYNTIKRIPWYGIGKQIAAFLNNIDWYGTITSVLRAISAAIQSLFEMLNGFVQSLKWSDIAQQIYTAINDSLNLIDWKKIGQTLGNAFVQAFEFVRKIIAGIDWHQIGKNIADFILGFDFVSALSSLAQLIATGINGAVALVNGFLSRHMQSELIHIAEGIANALREAIETVNWELLGAAIGNGIKTALGFIAGLLDPSLFYATGKAIGDFFVSLDWSGIVGGLARVLANAINSAVAAVKGFLDSVQPSLKEIADGIAAKINKFFDDVDWGELGKTISRGIEAALDFMIELVRQIDWDKIGQSISDFFTNIDWGTLFDKWGKLMGEVITAKMKLIDLSGILDVGKNIIKGLWDGMWTEFNSGGGLIGLLKRMIVDGMINKVKEWLGIHSPSTVFAEIGKNLVSGLIQGIKETWSGILEFFKEKVNAIVDFFNGAWDGIREKTSAAWNAIKTTLGGIWDNISEKASAIFEAIREKITDAWEKLKDKTKSVWESVKTLLSNLWDSIKSKSSDIFNSVKETISTIWDNIKTKTDEVWNNIKTFLSTLWENLKTTGKTVFENIKATISTIWENIKSKTAETWNSIKSTLTTLWNDLKTTAVNAFNDIKNRVIEVWTAIRNDAAAKWNEIKSTIVEKVNNIKQTVSEGFAKVKETITSKVTEAINALKSKDWTSVGKSIVNGISNGLNGIFDKLKTWASKVWDNVSNAFNGGSSRSTASSRSVSSRSISTFSSRMASDAVPAGYQAVQLPKLANGAVIPPNQQFLAILGDQRSGVNVEAPISTIKQAVADTIRDMGGIGGDIHITVESVLDGRVVARNTVKHINDMTTAAGRPVLLF